MPVRGGQITIDGKRVGVITMSVLDGDDGEDFSEHSNIINASYSPDGSVGGSDRGYGSSSSEQHGSGSSGRSSGSEGGNKVAHNRGDTTVPREEEKEKHSVRLGHKKGFRHDQETSPATGGGKYDARHDDTRVDHRVREIVSAAATHLPEGYRVEMTSGYRGPRVPNHSGNAADYHIVGPNGVLRNRGEDPTGMYQTLARHAIGEQRARYPELNGRLRWGGAFGTQLGGGGPRDLMHFDINGDRSPEGRYAEHRINRLGPMPGVQYGGNATASAPRAPVATRSPSGGKTVKGSWFDDRRTALPGVSAADTAGIALPTREGLGKMHEVTGPNGQTVILPQIDVGPAAWTGRGVDISAPALSKMGYNKRNFPTDAPIHVKPVAPKSVAETAKPPEDL